jgi:hypothetical protein
VDPVDALAIHYSSLPRLVLAECVRLAGKYAAVEARHGTIVRKLEAVMLAAVLETPPICEMPDAYLHSLEDALRQLLSATRPPSNLVKHLTGVLTQPKVKADAAAPGLPGSNVPSAVTTSATDSSRSAEIPTCEEVLAYASSQNCGMLAAEAHKFFDYWESVGWRNKNNQPIRCWRAAMRNWKTRAAEQAHRDRSNPPRMGGKGNFNLDRPISSREEHKAQHESLYGHIPAEEFVERVVR